MHVFLFLILALIVFSVVATAFVFWIWMLIDCAKYEPSKGNEKIVWILIIIFLQLIGALIYCFVRRPQRLRDAASQPPSIGAS